MKVDIISLQGCWQRVELYCLPDVSEAYADLRFHSYNESQRDALFLKFTYFGQVLCPSSGVSQHCIHAVGICHASSSRRQQN